MPIANIFAMVLGFVVAAIGVLGMAAPSFLLEFGRLLQSAGALWIVAALRIGFGAILLCAAPNSRTPRTLLVIGLFIVAAGLATPFFGVGRAQAMFDWWSAQGPFVMRALPMAAVGFGLFIAYVTLPRH